MTKKDIILIGMPGCGKTSIGRRIAPELKRMFLDLDAEIERISDKSIAQIFAREGEAAFRRIETEVFRKSLGQGCVIATGGGIVTQPENQKIAAAGLIVFADRPLEQILGDVDISARPLLAAGKERLYRLWKERYPVYCAWADIHIQNNGTMEEAAKKIIDEVNRYEDDGD
ncbi:shikimate kinase [Ructibacterium gallinarum]|uniref:Shikimate kinase n=1 Tax=Ructibacterium gallinarum TaxID=2779355 RepID=A0A9D5R801_9FIRM|nr:shikimate kinase [Ructibacterium gallinarum]MBE5039447.1 shikimate kinase [Ructibacterium gallinarum]